MLVVEDDEDIARLLAVALESARFYVEVLGDGRQALESVQASPPDVIVMDVDLPGLDGLSLCREVRKFSDVPVLMLSALREDVDKIVGLELGADDYLGKPFNMRELVARVRALHRRTQSRERAEPPKPTAQATTDSEVLEFGCLKIDVAARAVEVAGVSVHLTATEFSLLQVLAQRPGRVFSRQQLLDLVWGPEWVGTDRTVDVHLRRARSKLLEHSHHEFVEAVRGVGYKLALAQA
ncbi:response regulator transcription factor [bacterium]|nr:response regulator transcription factor [bacterium]